MVDEKLAEHSLKELKEAEPEIREQTSIVHADDQGVKDAIQRFKQSQKSEAAQSKTRVDDNTETAFPKMPGWSSLVMALSAGGLLLLFGQSYQQLMHVPMHLFWTACFFRLTQIADRAYGGKTNQGLIALISICAFLFCPIFPPPPGVSRFLDPFFLLWIVSQIAACWTVGMQIHKGSKSVGKDPVLKLLKPAVGLTVMGNLYILFGFFFPQLLNLEVAFDLLWFTCQAGWILMAKRTLDLDMPIVARLEKEGNKKELAFIEGEEIELRYRSFAAVERWMAQRFSAKGIKQGLKLFLMWICGPALVIGGVEITRMIWFSTVASDSSSAIFQNTAAGTSAGGGVQLFMLIFVLGFISIFLAAMAWHRSKPTHLLLSPKGLRFARKHKNGKPKLEAQTAWSNLVHIGIERPEGEASTLKDSLVFTRTDQSKLKVKLDSLDSYEDKEWILKAIKTWAPAVSRDAAVLQSLQAPADYSYTELWLQALSAPPQRERLKPLVPDTRLKQGKYLVRNSIGVGGQGQAYLAQDAVSAEQIVLKEFILPVFVDISIRKSALEQFENEARILRQLDNPNIVKLLDYFVEDHRAYLVLEHIDGASLRKLVESEGKLPEPQVRALAAQMCKILDYLHNRPNPVVHRDFTPDNLILNMDGTLKLIDFNVAQEQESNSTGTVVGKHAYLPPEQFRGMPCAQSDIYAMGATLHYLLTAADPEPISTSHPKQSNPAISDAIDALIAKATAPDLRKRYGSINDLKSDL